MHPHGFVCSLQASPTISATASPGVSDPNEVDSPELRGPRAKGAGDFLSDGSPASDTHPAGGRRKRAELAGPDDPFERFAAINLTPLLRSSIHATAVGGNPDDWKGLDTEMALEGHRAAPLRPVRRHSASG